MSSINSVEDLYQLAKNDIKGKPGSIMIYVDGIPHVSSSNDIVGNCLQEWLPAWFKDNGLHLIANEETQKFPDFTAIFGEKRVAMDIKCWNYGKTPAFDLANFDSFYRTTWSDPSKIFAKYLIIGYEPNAHGFKIMDVFLKNMWEIMSNTTKYPIGLQVKQGSPYAMRPSNFLKKKDKMFKSPEELVCAVRDTRDMFPSNHSLLNFSSDEWYNRLIREINQQHRSTWDF